MGNCAPVGLKARTFPLVEIHTSHFLAIKLAFTLPFIIVASIGIISVISSITIIILISIIIIIMFIGVSIVSIMVLI